MKPAGDYYTILNFFRMKRGWIRYNALEGKNLCKERYVIIRKNEVVKEYYILVVRPTSVDGEYRRVRVGLIQSHYVIRERLNVRVM